MQQHTGDRSVHQTTPILNGYPTKIEPASLPSRPLRDICLDIRKKVDDFLDEEPATTILQDVQARVREAIGVVNEAFRRYEYVANPRPLAFLCIGPYHALMQRHVDLGKYPFHITAERTVSYFL
jgi:hypothetical protein